MEEQDKYYAPVDKNDERNIKKKQEKEEKELKKLQAKQAKLDAEKNDWLQVRCGTSWISLNDCNFQGKAFKLKKINFVNSIAETFLMISAAIKTSIINRKLTKFFILPHQIQIEILLVQIFIVNVNLLDCFVGLHQSKVDGFCVPARILLSPYYFVGSKLLCKL